jgi:hypothetical protein
VAAASFVRRAQAVRGSPLSREPRASVAGDAVRAQWQAGLARLEGRRDEALWLAAARAWQAIGRPEPTAAMLVRAAEAARSGPAPTWPAIVRASARSARACWQHA